MTNYYRVWMSFILASEEDANNPDKLMEQFLTRFGGTDIWIERFRGKPSIEWAYDDRLGKYSPRENKLLDIHSSKPKVTENG